MHFRHQQGFTLIEIIIVLLIIGIIATFASLRFTAMDDQREVRLFAESLTHEFQLANQVAQLMPAELGFDSQQSSYQFYQLVSNSDRWDWEVIDYTHLLKPRLLPDNVVITIQSDPSRIITLEKNNQWVPSIQFFSNGQITPFAIIISEKDDTRTSYTITSNLAGGVILQ